MTLSSLPAARYKSTRWRDRPHGDRRERSRELVSIRGYNHGVLTLSPRGSNKEQFPLDLNLVLAFPDPAFWENQLRIPSQLEETTGQTAFRNTHL